MRRSMKVLFFIFTFFVTLSSFANNPGVSYQGRIFKPDGNPLEGTTVQFRMQVRSPGSENCLLYEEVQTLNMAGSSGVFALTLNDGTGTRLDAATYQVDRIFANRETMTLDTTRCATGTTYTPNSSDGRKLVVYFKDETMAAYEAMPLMNLNYVPQAMYALEAQKVDKFAVSNILRAVDGSGNPATAPALNPTQLLNLTTLLATPAANYVQTTSNGSVALPVVAGNPSSGLAAGQIWYDSGSNVMKYYDGAVKTFGTSGGGLSSVGLTLPGMFSVTNSPLTANGSITATLANQTANSVFAGPSSGGPAAPTFRALASTDLPITGAAGTFINGGNSFGVAGNIGTNDAFDLNLKTNNTTKMTILSNGNVGVGTTAPGTMLEINGSAQIGSLNSTASNAAPSLAVGSSNLATGGYSFSQGSGNISTGASSFSSGVQTAALGAQSAAFGLQTSAGSRGEFAVGTYGLSLGGSTSSLVSTDPVFTIGNGTSMVARSNAMTVLKNGNVGIGTTSPQTTLQVAGIISPATNNTYSLGNATYRFTEVYATNGTINTSDRREKKDIYDTDLGLDFINKLRPVSYRWNTGVDDDVHYGLIAQEAEQVIAETGKSEKTSIVTHDETTDRYGVRYSELISPLIKAVQELYNRFLGVDREIASVKAENATIKQENATIKQENATIKQENAEVKARLDQQEKQLAAIKNKLGL